MNINSKNGFFKLLFLLVLFSFLAACGGERSQPERKEIAELQSSQSGQTNMEKTEENELPFACNMKAMTAEQRQRYNELTKRLQIAGQEVKELPDGFAFRLPGDSTTVQEAAEWISYERLCCPFFDFGIDVNRNNGAVWLRLGGREGIKPFIKSEFGM